MLGLGIEPTEEASASHSSRVPKPSRQTQRSPLLEGEGLDAERPAELALPCLSASASFSSAGSVDPHTEDDIQLLEFIHKMDLFHDVPDEELPTLAKAFTTRKAGDGEVIVRQGEEGHELYLIQSGTVAFRASAPGVPEKTMHTLSQGEYFGETSLLTSELTNASVYAVGDVLLQVLSRQDFERFDLQSKLHLRLKYSHLQNSGLRLLFRRLATVKTFIKAITILTVYFLLSALIFSHLEGWHWSDCMYFAAVTLTTVGYGDFSPKHPYSRLFVVAFILISVIGVAAEIGEFLKIIVSLEIKNERARKALALRDPRAVGIFDTDAKRYHWRRKFFYCMASLAALLGVGCLLARFALDDCNNWTDALYFSVVTLSTVGYGDIYPKERYSRWAVSAIMLVGVPMFGILLARIVEIAYGKAHLGHVTKIVGGLTNEQFDALIDFTDDLWRAGAYNKRPQESRREQITPFEFLCFILAKNETVTMEEIKAIMANFDELDTDSNGLLEQMDVEEWLRRGSKNPRALETSPRKQIRRSISSPSSEPASPPTSFTSSGARRSRKRSGAAGALFSDFVPESGEERRGQTVRELFSPGMNLAPERSNNTDP